MKALDGWAKIDKTIRQLDEDKVRDCKEDMDTLLVFVSFLLTLLLYMIPHLRYRQACTPQF